MPGAPKRWLFDRRSSPELTRLLGHPKFAELARRGVSTPDHVIRTKGAPLALDAISDGPAWLAEAERRLSAFVTDYRAYFERNDARLGHSKRMLDPLPRLIAIPDVGLIGVEQ